VVLIVILAALYVFGKFRRTWKTRGVESCPCSGCEKCSTNLPQQKARLPQ
ncbi:MAG: hypothetical protein DRH11_15535, partial [Deltaproteobacteria bacterium]